MLANAAARKFEKETEQENLKSLDNLISSVEVYNADGSARSREDSPLIRALNGEILLDFEEIVVFPSTGKKRYRNVTSAPINDNNNKITGAVAVVRDITDRKTIEAELDMYRKNLERLVIARTADLEDAIKSLRESEEHYLTLFNSIDEGFCTIEVIFDSDNNPIDYQFLEINPAFTKQTGLEDAGGKLMRDLAPDHEEHWFEIYGKIALTGKPMRFVNPAKELNRWYDVYAFKIGSPESRQVAILFKDITKFKKLEKELREYQDTLEEEVKKRTEALTESNKELEQFAYITSHDLREPLRMITSFLQLLERRYKDQLDQDANEFIGFAADGAKRLDAMTNDLLQYSKISNKKRELIPVNFEHVLEHALTNLKVQIEENNAIITHDPLPTIIGDEQLKIQLFQNIIGNAIKYRSQENPKIHISATKEKNQYLFSIEDNGIGMSHEHLEKIFTIFQRLHTHEEYEGTGIGLAIAHKIVHQQGGQIWVESVLGKGSTFYFTIRIQAEN
nr:ATP-binding protein [Methanobacterium sp. SMA-27]